MEKLICILFLISACICYPTSNFSQYVNPFIGTGGDGFGIGGDPPGPMVPFGLCRVSPDTVNWENVYFFFNHFGGYYYDDDHIRLFSHTHMVGSGASDLGNIGVMPTNRAPKNADLKDYGFRSTFSHTQEKALPGYYNVMLLDSNVNVELTSTQLAAHHRYTWNAGDPRFVTFNISTALQEHACTEANINIDPQNREVNGWMRNDGGLSNRFGGVVFYFVAKFPQSFSSYGVWKDETLLPNVTSIDYFLSGAYVSFPPSSSPLEFTLGISCLSIEQARENVATQIGNKTFDEVRNDAHNLWETYLNTVQVQSVNSDSLLDLEKFYTFLYRTFNAPTNYSEAGQYLGFDNKVHQLTNTSSYYSDMSIWDIHRTQTPFFALTHPQVSADICNSLTVMFEQGGSIPRWPLANGYTCCMIGQHANIIIADSYIKGVRGFDAQRAYQGMYQSSTKVQNHCSRQDLSDWITKGYVVYEETDISACLTLAYSYDDFAVSQMASALNYTVDQQMFYNRSKNFINTWSPVDKYYCPRRRDGTFDCPLLKTDVFDSRYVEGDANHYRYHGFWHLDDLIKLFGSQQELINELTLFLELSNLDTVNILPNPFYWAGNEEDLFAPWLFGLAGRPDLTQKYVNMLRETKYLITPNGLPGNDDYGTMSAWYVWSALGFYPLAATTTYVLGNPLFPEMTINRKEGNIQISAINLSKQNFFVEKVFINDILWKSPTFDHSQISNGGKIVFYMTSNQTNFISH